MPPALAEYCIVCEAGNVGEGYEVSSATDYLPPDYTSPSSTAIRDDKLLEPVTAAY